MRKLLGALAGAALLGAVVTARLTPGVVGHALEGTPFASYAEVPAPGGAGSAQPHLEVASDGRVFLSWIESADGRAVFKFAEWRAATTPPPGGSGGAGAWTAPVAIAAGANFFVNWADVPSIAALDGGRLAAHWLQKSGPGTYAYDVKLKVSDDGGRTWVGPMTPHSDGTPTEHGFASLADWPDGPRGTLVLVWLDGRKMAGHDDHGAEMKGEMTLRATTLTGREMGPDMVIDERVCECCPTAAVTTARGMLVAYRDRSEQEIRDIYLARHENGAWTKPYPVHRDNWKIGGCPVNGPALAALGNRVVIAWFTAAGDEARVNVAFSGDGGATFSAPVRADEGSPLGRVDVELLPDGSALAMWLEHDAERSEIRVRRIARAEAPGKSMAVAAVASERASGYPRMVRSGNVVYFAWTAVEKQVRQLRTASATLR